MSEFCNEENGANRFWCGARGCLLAVCAILLLTFSAPSAQADITLAKVFSDNMVIQQNASVRVWGMANPEEKITVTFAGKAADPGGGDEQTATAKADTKGRWSTLIKTGDAGGPYTLEVTVDKSDTKVLVSDVLLGEVWICAGEQNMGLPLGETEESEGEIEQAKNFTKLRMFQIDDAVATKPQYHFGQVKPWASCSVETVKDYSAVAYFFGRELSTKIEVPIGLISATSPAAYCESWISSDALERDGSFSDLIEHWKEQNDPTNENQLSAHFNAMIAPLRGFPFRGIIWYQGESNVGRGNQYRRLLPLLIKDWRNRFMQTDFPFYFVQLPPKRYEGLATTALPEMWDAQLGTLLSTKNTGMAVTTDIGDIKQAKNKKEIGRRLALWALGNQYLSKKPRAADKKKIQPPVPQTQPPTPRKKDNNDANESPTAAGFYVGRRVAGIQQEREPQLGKGQIPREKNQQAADRSTQNQEEQEDQQEEQKGEKSSRRKQEPKAAPKLETPKLEKQEPPKAAAKTVKIVFSGPIYKSHKLDGKRFVISFDHAVGLQSVGNESPSCFLICGEDKKFVPAIAKIEGETIVVYNPNIAEPVAVRFVWEDTAKPNLFNSEGLPASPFRTDDFDLISKGIEY